jgi:thymidine kinase
MEYVFVIGLTLAIVWSIIEFNRYKVSKILMNVRYSQSDIHQTIRSIVPKKTNNKKEIESQSARHAADTMIKIIVIDNKAYWVKDNVFYFSETNNGDIVNVTAKPVEISNMSKQDIDKMLFILDNLRKGNVNDSSSAGNEQL